MESDQPTSFAQSTTTFKFKSASIISSKVYHCGHHLKENGLSFSAFLLCTIFLYILLCYNSNPSSSVDLLHTTKFWFLLSNTLIIILTIDSGVLSNSSSKAQQKEEEAYYSPQTQNQLEYVTNGYDLTTTPAFTFRFSENQEITNKRKISNHKSLKANHTDVDINDQPEVLEKTIVVDETSRYINDEKDQDAQAHEKVKIVVQKTRRSSINTTEDRSCRRTKSERIFRPINIDEPKKKVVPRSQSTKSEPKNIIDEEEVDGFSTMSNEELNKRVEDFITEFYRQQLTSEG